MRRPAIPVRACLPIGKADAWLDLGPSDSDTAMYCDTILYLMTGSTDSPRHHPGALVRGAFSGLSGLLLALVVALGIPLLWIWIASQLAGTKRDLTPSLALLITTGILVS